MDRFATRRLGDLIDAAFMLWDEEDDNAALLEGLAVAYFMWRDIDSAEAGRHLAALLEWQPTLREPFEAVVGPLLEVRS